MDGIQDKLQGILSDPESMQQLSELAQMLQGGETPPSAPAADETAPAVSGMPDVAMLMKLGEMMQGSGSDDKNTALLRALRPHLGERRQHRLDKALRLMQLWTMMQAMQKSGVLQDLL